MPATDADTSRSLLKLMRNGQLPAGSCSASSQEARLNQLLDGQIPTATLRRRPPGGGVPGAGAGGVRLLSPNCLPNLFFEGLDDATELLLPDVRLATRWLITAGFRRSIHDADCDDVENIGLAVQLLISPRKKKR